MPPEKLKQIIRENVRARREEIGMTQLQLAAKVSMTGPAISQIERGHCSVSVEVLANIAQALGIQPSRLLVEHEFAVEEAVA